VTDVVRLPDGATTFPDLSRVALLDARTGKRRCIMPGNKAAFSPDGRLLTACGHPRLDVGLQTMGNFLRLFDSASGEELRRLRTGTTVVAFSPVGLVLAAAG